MARNNRIRELRKAHTPPLTQRDLADALGISRSIVSRMETKGEYLDLERIERLANLFDVQPAAILTTVPSLSEFDHRLLALTKGLSQEGRSRVLDLMEAIKLQEELRQRTV